MLSTLPGVIVAPCIITAVFIRIGGNDDNESFEMRIGPAATLADLKEAVTAHFKDRLQDGEDFMLLFGDRRALADDKEVSLLEDGAKLRVVESGEVKCSMSSEQNVLLTMASTHLSEDRVRS